LSRDEGCDVTLEPRVQHALRTNRTGEQQACLCPFDMDPSDTTGYPIAKNRWNDPAGYLAD
jgi:hypothetical protein